MNPRPKQLSSRDNDGIITEGKFLKANADGTSDYDVLLESDLSQKFVKRGPYTFVTIDALLGSIRCDGMDLGYSLRHDGTTTGPGVASAAPYAGPSAFGTFLPCSTTSVASNAAGWVRTGSLAHRVDGDLRAFAKFFIGGSITDMNFGLGLTLDSVLTDVLLSDMSTKNFVGIQYVDSRDSGTGTLRFVTSNTSTATEVDTGAATLSAGVYYLEMDISVNGSFVRFILRDEDFVVLSDETITTSIPGTTTSLAPIGAIQTDTTNSKTLYTSFFLLDSVI
tara:strand:- start:97916 stop:98752 length:837 start_codon:yes stop_codon:yes gene_type:complete